MKTINIWKELFFWGGLTILADITYFERRMRVQEQEAPGHIASKFGGKE